MTEQAKNLYQKIQAVMEDVEYIVKDAQISFKSTNYKAVSEEMVTSTVRKSLIKHGLVILPIEQEHIKDGSLTTVNTKYKIVDVDTGNSEILMSSGTGADTQDKGVGKAMTYSYKYLLLRTFAIPTGEDPDKTSSAELDEKHSNGSQQPSSNGSLASEKQLNLVKSLLKKKVTGEWTFEKLHRGIKQKLNTTVDMENWTKSQASKAIEILQADKKEQAEETYERTYNENNY